MEHHPSDKPAGPRRELSGPRPPPLKVRKDSHKAKKPPPPAQHRPPVIIYAVSPKVIHADPSEFMSVVQRLTGPSSSSAATTSTANTIGEPSGPAPGGGVLSPVPESLLPMPTNLLSPMNMNISSSYVDNTFAVSPNNDDMVATPSDAYWDLFSQDQDFKGL